MQLSQEEVSRLSNQEQEAYARVILDASRNRRVKLEQAKTYPGRYLITGILLLFVSGTTYISHILSLEVLLSLFVVVGLMQWHILGLNKRIDTLLDLLDLKEDAMDARSRKRDEPSE